MTEVSKFKIALKGRGRMLLALLLALVFIFVRAAFPTLPISDRDALLVIGIIVAYIFGEGISGKTFDDSFLTLLKSQKFQAFAAGIAVMLVKMFAPSIQIGENEVMAVLGTLATFIIASGTQPGQPAPEPKKETKSDTEPPVLG